MTNSRVFFGAGIAGALLLAVPVLRMLFGAPGPVAVDAVVGVFGVVLLALLYLGYTQEGVLPFGAVPNVVAHIRFNGPLFRFVAGLSTPQIAAAFAVGSGMLVASWCRWKLGSDNPASWAWPPATCWTLP